MMVLGRILTSPILCAIGVLLGGAAVLSAVRPATQPLNVGTKRQLFIDQRFIASSRGVGLVVQRPRPTGERLLVPEHPWEDFWMGSYKTVLQDGERIHIWYGVASKRDGRNQNSVAYAYSTDGGATFIKPELGVVDFEGSSRNNLVLSGVHGSHVADNRPDAPAAERYILFAGKPNRAFVSPDGIRWTPTGQVPFLDTETYKHMTLDSQNVVFWDKRLGSYVAYARFNLPNTRGGSSRILRTFWRSEGKTFGDFPSFTEVFAPDSRDPVEFDWYTTAALEYTGAADAYFMWPAAYHHFPPPPTNDGLLDIQFACSRDGVRWLRPDRRPVIRLGPEGSWNGGALYAGYGLTRQGDELSLYYTARDVSHDGYNRRDGYLGGVITRAIYRLDGFMSLDAGYDGGEFTTPLLIFDGSRLLLNFDGSAGGWCRVELRDVQGKPIPGFTENDADRISGNSVATAVTWGGNGDLSRLRGQPVVLRFIMRDASLFAFQFH